MTLDAKLLKKLSDWQPACGRRQLTVVDEATGWTVDFTVDRRDELSCLLWELSVARGQAPAAETLRTWAGRLEKNIAGLLEPIKILEIDEQRNEGILRSDEPHANNEALLHYEIFLTGVKSAAVRRYKAPANKTGKREQIAFALTNEGLLRLISGLTSEK